MTSPFLNIWTCLLLSFMSVGMDTRRNIFKNANCPMKSPPNRTKIIHFLFVSSLLFINGYSDHYMDNIQCEPTAIYGTSL